MRDTDADWRHLGETDPFFGVVTDPKFHAEAITPEGIDDFYETGRQDVRQIVDMVTHLTGSPGNRVLDVGCGVGRLTEAMANLGYRVTGYDISPGMLAKARARGDGRVTYVDRFPSESFDWVNSFIVLQHIPPERGIVLIEQMAEALTSGGVLSLHLTFGEDPTEATSPSVEGAPPPLGVIWMHTYDLTAVFNRLWDKGIRRLSLEQVQHGSYRGFFIIGRRA